MIAVVVPTRNRAPYLQRLLDALDRQTYAPFEIVIVDDASTDETSRILEFWRDDNHIPLRQDVAGGSYTARNRGWRQARGELIAFTDDDCVPHPEWLAALVAQMNGPLTVGVQGRTLAGPGPITPFTHQIEQQHGGPPYRTCNILYRRAELERQGGFEDDLRWYADNIFGLRAREAGHIAFAPDAVVDHPPRSRDWRTRDQWVERFRADAVHRGVLQELGVEPAIIPGTILPVILWIARPLMKQSLTHLRFAIRHPSQYVAGMHPMLREKWAMLLAMGDYWREKRSSPVEADAGHSGREDPGRSPVVRRTRDALGPGDTGGHGEPPLPKRAIGRYSSRRERGWAYRDAYGAAFPSRPRESPPTFESKEESTPLVTVVIVTRERPQFLAGALEALSKQSYPNADVLVVDKGHGEASPVAAQFGARYCNASGTTLGEARQTGVQHAIGSIVAFTDDDCVPHADWIASLTSALARHPEWHGVQGRTNPAHGPVGRHAISVQSPSPLFHTCNIAYRRESLELAGGFDTGFVGWFEDTALAARVLALGPIGWEPNAVVTHQSMPRRFLDQTGWTQLLADERRLAARYPEFYRKTRGSSVLMTVILRWLIGSPAKTLLRELPRLLRHPRTYSRLSLDLFTERLALIQALASSSRSGPTSTLGRPVHPVTHPQETKTPGP